MVKRIKIVKKRTNKFIRFEADTLNKLSRTSWRKPKGIDNRVRRRFRGNMSMPKIGFGSNTRTKHLLPNYRKKLLIHNSNDLELLLMNSDKYCAEIAKGVGAKKRIEILRKAKEMSVRITNRKSAKITKLEERVKSSK